MIVTRGHKLFGKVQVTDFRGAILGSVFYFNTKTKRVKIYVPVKYPNGKSGVAVSGTSFYDKGNKAATASFILKGAKLINKVTKKEIK